MTLQQTLQANDGKTKELFDKLEDTSDQAVKTRENLFSELSRELRLHADLEQRHLFPALRNDGHNKELISEAAKVNRELRAKIDEIEALPKGDSSFRPRLAELRKLYQQQTREERRELLPAAKKALGQEEAEAVERRMEARRARAEEEQRAEAEERRDAARRDDEHAKAVAARKRAAAEVVEAAKLNARDLRKSTGEAVQHGASSARKTSEKAVASGTDALRRVRERASDAARRVREEASQAARRISDEARETVTAYRETARERGADVKAVASALRDLAKAGPELRSVMLNSLKQSGRDGLESSRQLLRNPLKFGQVQRDYAAAATRNLMESTNAMLQVVRSATAASRQPVEQRLRAVA